MPPLEFFAETDPSPARCNTLAALNPANPFATYRYVQAERSANSAPWLLGCSEGGSLRYGCLSFLRSGRINRILTIPSLPAAQEVFWDGLRNFSRSQKISILELNSFSSPAVSIPALGEETMRIKRYEFVVRLEDRETTLLERMRTNHRQSVRKGMKAGLRVRITTDSYYLDDHIRLIIHSKQRREARGETVSFKPTLAGLQPYLESGLCRLFQALYGEETVSSMMVATADRGSYLSTAGTSPSGLNIGASHFLVHEILQSCQQAGAVVFNLGGVTDLNSGLAQYKRHFGAHSIALEAAAFYAGNRIQRAVSRVAQVVQGILQHGG